MHFKRFCWVFTGLFLLWGGTVFAQVTTGTILGTISDSTGAVIPGATITMRNVGTGITRTANTDAAGRYRAPQLPLGDYEITAEMPGFQSVDRSGVTLTVGREAEVDFTLQVGAVTERITVTGEAPLIETTNATVSTLVDERTLREMPLLGRSFADLAAIQPGVVSDLPIGTSGYNAIYSGGGGVSRRAISGTNPQNSTYLLDGIELTTPSRGMAVNSVMGEQLGVDAIREFTLLQSNYGAQYGRSAGGVMNAVTQSGTNEFHGGVFEFFRNDKMDARDYFLDPKVAKAPLRRNQFGGFVGGPIQKDRTFFFANYEGLRLASGESTLGATLTPSTWTGKITGCPGGASSCKPEAAIVTSTLVMNPTIKAVFQPILPLPNGDYRANGSADYSAVDPWSANETYLIGRMDRQLDSNNSLFVRVTKDTSEKISILNLNIPNHFISNQEGGYWVAAVSWTRIIGTSVLNTARVGFTRRADSLYYNYTRGGDQFTSGALDPRLSPIKGEPLGRYGISGVSIYGGIGPDIQGPASFFDNTFDYDDSLIVNRGRHSMTLGANFKRYQMNGVSSDAWAAGNLSWQTIERFIVNNPYSTTQVLGLGDPATQLPDTIRGWRQAYGAAYFQDDFRVWPNLTVNLGVRWERVRAPREVNGKMARLVDIYKDAELTRFTSDDPYFDIQDGMKGFSPRVGFAWTPFANQKTVLRGGFGSFNEVPLGYLYLTANGVPPISQRLQVNNPKWPYPFSDPSTIKASKEPLIMANDFKMSYILQWTLSVEQQLGQNWVFKANYLGMRGLNQFGQINPNQALAKQDANGRWYTPVDAKNPNGYFPNPNFVSYRYYSPFGDQYFHAGQFVVEKRFAQGVRFNVSYTWAKNINSGAVSTRGGENVSGSPNASGNIYDLAGEKGLSGIHIAHNFIASYTYELPFGNGRPLGSQWTGVVDRLFGGWMVSGSGTLRSGLPGTLTMTPKQSRCIANHCPDRPNLIPGGNNNPVLKNWTRELYYDPLQFSLPTLGYFGNVGRNTLIQPGQVTMNLSVSKVNRLGEGKNLAFRAEFFNLFNHVNYGGANLSVFRNAAGALNGSVGRITDTATPMRRIQLGFKLTF